MLPQFSAHTASIEKAPETMSPHPPPPLTPKLGRRLLCLLYESFLIAAVLFVFFLMPQALYGSMTGHAASPGVLLIHVQLLCWAYFVGFWQTSGQTLAMKTWRIRLVTTTNQRLSWPKATLRYVAACFSVSVLGLGFLWALLDQEGQYLHDRIAGTRLRQEN